MKSINLDGWESYSRGWHAEILKKEDKVIKVPHKPFCSILQKLAQERINNEFLIHERLFSQGIKVAKPYDLVEVRLGRYKVGAIIMEFIEGISPLNLPFTKRMEIVKYHSAEIKKCEQLGFEPNDASLNNCIYSETNGIYLIDFANWRRE